MSGFDVDSYIQDHTGGSKDSGFDVDSYISDHSVSSKKGFFDGAVKSTIDSLPMIGGMVGGVLGTPADVVAGPMGNVAGAAVGGYLGTATKNLINKYYDPQSAPKTTTDAIIQPITGGVEQGLMQGVGEGVAPLVSKGVEALGGATKWGATKLLSNLGGVKPDVIKEYSQFSDRINSAPNISSLKDVSDQFVGQLASDVENKKMNLDQAQKAFDGFQNDLKGAYQTAGFDSRAAVTSAEQSLKDAHNSRLQQLSGDIYNTVNQLKSDVQTGSAKALDVLDKANTAVDVSPTLSKIDDTIGNLKKAGTDESLSVAEKLQAYKARLAEQAGANAEIPATSAKALIQGIDRATDYSPMAGAFDKAKNAAFKGIRGTLDQSVKSAVPEYAQAMQPVAQNADLLNRVQGFGDRYTGVGLLQRINAPNQLENRAALQELGQKYGADFVSSSLPENLPEQQILNKSLAVKDALRPDRVADKIDQTVANSRQKSALDAAQSGLETAQNNLAPFKSLAPNDSGQTTAQQKLEQLGKGGNIELTDMFQKLGNLTNTDFVQAMKDQRILAAFTKGATNGSRNTLMGSLVGTIAGFGLGGGALGAAEGASVGASAGRIVDQWGPAITKKVLDGVIKVSKSPTVATISNLELPDTAKRAMAIGLQNYLTKNPALVTPQLEPAFSGGAQPSSQANRTPAVGEAKWAQSGLQKLGIQDPDLTARLIQDPKARQLLIQASDLAPNSKAMKQIMNQIQTQWGKAQ